MKPPFDKIMHSLHNYSLYHLCIHPCNSRIHPTSPHKCNHLFLFHTNRILNSRQQRLRIRTHNLLNLLLVLEDQEGRHGADTELLRDIGDFIDVELDEVGTGEFFGEPLSDIVSIYLQIKRDWEGRWGMEGGRRTLRLVAQ
jgi:hypothetical protein